MLKSAEELVAQAHEAGASDIHLVCDLPPKYRIDGRLETMPGCEPLTHKQCEMYAQELSGKGYDSIKDCGELDLAHTIAGVRVRINLFRQKGSVSAALRLLSDVIPPLDELGLSPAVLDFPRLQRGIILVTGETGSGKSTTWRRCSTRSTTRAPTISSRWKIPWSTCTRPTSASSTSAR